VFGIRIYIFGLPDPLARGTVRTRLQISGIAPRVVDPYSFFTDPDPELDGGGQYGSGSNTDPGF
jgi:hypothetical protein